MEIMNRKNEEVSFNTRLHQKDFDLRFDESRDALSKQHLPHKPFNRSRKERKKKQNQSKKKMLSKKQTKKSGCENTQCSECGEWYSNKIIAIHASQCRLLKEGFAMDIGNQNEFGFFLQNEPAHFSRKSRIHIKCAKQKNRNDATEDTTLKNCRGTTNGKHSAYRLHQAFEAKCALSGATFVLSEIPLFQVDSTDFTSLGLTEDAPVKEKKARIREMLIRWHPDRFIQRFRTALRIEDIPMIELRLNEIIRILSTLKANLPR